MGPHRIELGYVGLEVTDRAAFGGFLTDVVGLLPGAPTTDGDATWRNDAKAQRLVVAEGQTDDATFVGFEAVDAAAFGPPARRSRPGGRPTWCWWTRPGGCGSWWSRGWPRRPSPRPRRCPWWPAAS